MFDGDEAGENYVPAIETRGFGDDELTERCHRHPDGDLEAQLVADGMGSALRQTLGQIGVRDAHGLSDGDLVAQLRRHKTAFAVHFAGRIRSEPGLAHRMPTAFREGIAELRGLA